MHSRSWRRSATMPGPDFPLIVVKVGGSLFNLPDLGLRLQTYFAQFEDARILIVPGGGAVADVVRQWDQTHRLGEEPSHWLALGATALCARFLMLLLPDSRTVDHPGETRSGFLDVLNPLAFVHWDERSATHLPHRWDVTTDAIAARAAIVGGAWRLILLKSADMPGGMSWRAAAEADLVDRVFPSLIEGLQVDWVNF